MARIRGLELPLRTVDKGADTPQKTGFQSKLLRFLHSVVAKQGGLPIQLDSMPTVAEQLRSAREAMKLDVYQVADITKIRTDHIRALEAGDYEPFMAPVYIRGFVRTYAALLKLDVPKIIEDLNGELKNTEKFAEPPSLTNQPKSWLDILMLYFSRIDWRIMLGILGAAVVILGAVFGYRMWYAHKTSDPLKKLGPGMIQKTNVNQNTLPLPGQQAR